MKFHTGDRVYVKKLNKEGEVLHTVDTENILVRLENGEEISFLEEELDYPYLNWFRKAREKKQKKKEKGQGIPMREDPTPKVSKGIYLLFWPEYHSEDFDDIIEEVKIYFHNETSKEMEFYYNFKSDNRPGFELKKKVKAFENFYLHKLSLEDLLDRAKFILKGAPLGQSLSDLALPMKTNKIVDELNLLAEKSLPSLQLSLADDIHVTYVAPDESEEDFIDIDQIKIGSKKNENKLSETKDKQNLLDLHIEELFPENWNNINPRHILDIQTKIFENFLSDTIRNGSKKLTVIHGIGEGILRDRVHEILQDNNFVKKFENELHPDFGYGATEVWLK